MSDETDFLAGYCAGLVAAALAMRFLGLSWDGVVFGAVVTAIYKYVKHRRAMRKRTTA
jgi:hypothetical protein